MANWGLINNGDTFQALVNTLLLFENRSIRVFGRPGRDSAIDAQTEDKTAVWQCKFHKEASLAKAITDALSELTKITEYRRPSNPRASLWTSVIDWTLVTNLKLNPSDRKKWDDGVVPSFHAIGLRAEIWGEEKLEELLTRHPAVQRAFFEGENRNFLSLSEAFAAYQNENPQPTNQSIPIKGRDETLARLLEFLSGPKKLICVHGPGGVGKSRLLLEIGVRAPEDYQVLWANVETMSQSSNWLSSIVPEQPTLLLFDEPTDARVLWRIAEQMRSPAGRMASWKVVVTTRSPNDPIVNAYNELPSALREEPLELMPLLSNDALQVILALMQQGALAAQPDDKKAAAATQIFRITSGIPIWMALAVQVLETNRNLSDLPSSIKDIAKKYLSEVIEHQSERVASKTQIESLINWLAIYRQVNIEDKGGVEFLARKAGFGDEGALLRAIRSLVQRRFVTCRGMNRRLHEIKPDVINDFILSEWLTDNEEGSYSPSIAAKDVVTWVLNGFEGKPIPNVQEIVRTLAVVELKERWQGRSIGLLNPLVNGLVEAAETGPLTAQQVVIGILKFFSFARVKDTVNVIRTIRLHPFPNEEIANILFEDRTLTHQEVVDSLAWPLFCAGQYATTAEERKSVLDEMVALFNAEPRRDARKRNTGETVKDLIPRLIEGGKGFRSSYVDDAFERGKLCLSKIQERGISSVDELDLARVFLKPFVSVERSQTNFNDNSFTVTNWLVLPVIPEGVRRSNLRITLRNFTANEDAAVAEFAWDLLLEAHSSANRARQRNNAVFEADLKEDLEWVKEWISQPGVTTVALQRARRLWDWHARFEETPHLKQIADECEEIYANNDSAKEFDVFFDLEKYQEADKRAAELGQALAGATADQLIAFIARAESFAGRDAHWGEFYKIGTYLAASWATNCEISEFVRRVFAHPDRLPCFELGIAILEERFKTFRENHDIALERELEQTFAWNLTNDSKVRFLALLYGRPHPVRTGLLTSVDNVFFLRHRSVFEEKNEWELIYRILGGMFHTNWASIRQTVEELWPRTSDTIKANCYFNLLDGISFIRLFKDTYPVSMDEQHYHFLIDLLLDVPDIDELAPQVSYGLEKIRDSIGRMPLAWLAEAFRRRSDLFNPNNPDGRTRQGRVVPSHLRLSKFVQQISTADASNPNIRQTAQDLLDFNLHHDLIGYYLPEYLSDIDPEGNLIPDLVVAKIRSAGDKAEVIYTWSRYAESYEPNSDPWRKIASAAVVAASSVTERSKSDIYLSLESSVRSSSYPSGEMDPQPAKELEECIRLRDSETDPNLRDYRDWKVRQAQAQYDFEVERHREEKGQ